MNQARNANVLIEEVLAESRLPASKRNELRKELESHVWEAALALKEKGMNEEEIRSTIRDGFGKPKKIGQSFSLIYRDFIMRIFLWVLVGIGALTALAYFKESVILIPDGWYLHHTKTARVILTRQPDLSEIGAIEGLAYGEQIDFETVKMDKPMEQWIATRIPEGDPLYTSKERGFLNGYPTLKVEHETEASGKILDYYLFDDGNAHIFSLYPLESTDAAGKNAVRNTTGIQTLEQIVKDYATKI